MKGSMQAMQEEMKKIRGVPVLTTTTTTMMKDVTMKSSRELLEIKEDTAPAGTFDVLPIHETDHAGRHGRAPDAGKAEG